MMMKNVKVMTKKITNIEQEPLKSNQLSSGELICGSVTIDDSSSNNNTSIKQYISVVNNE